MFVHVGKPEKQILTGFIGSVTGVYLNYKRITNPIFNRYYNNFLLEMQSKVNEMKN